MEEHRLRAPAKCLGLTKENYQAGDNCTVTRIVFCALQQIKSWRLRWAERVALMLEEIYANRIMVGKPEWEDHLECLPEMGD